MAEIGTNIEKAAEILQQGGLVGIPTETVYGLAANALNSDAVSGIFVCKNRPSFDPLIVHIAGIEDLSKYASDIPEIALKLANAFWPGPLTLLLHKKDIIPDITTSGLPTVGIRVPDQELTLSLLKNLSFPLAAPSANPFGYVSPTSAKHVNDQLGDKLQYILDGSNCGIGLESTIVGFDQEGAVIHRLGGLSVEDIEKVAGKTKLQISSSSNPTAPGQLDVHYAPKCKIMLESDTAIALEKLPEGSKIALIRYQKLFPEFSAFDQFVLASDGNSKTAAKRLFAILRLLDQYSYQYAIAEPAPELGLGLAINDRLRRASVQV